MRALFTRFLLIAAGLLLLPIASFAQVGIAVTVAPPALPVYEQPVCPGDGYIWTPGYWAWADGDYYWVPGTWVVPPQAGFLWTPGYWGWGDNAFVFNQGYWGTSIGFYGGIDYGYGYFGHGYEGGRWNNGRFFYNTTVNNVNVNVVHNVYNTRVNVAAASHVSFNGGNGGINVRATAQEDAAARGQRIAPVAAQTEHAEAARNEPQQRFAANHGTPAVAATAKPGAFNDRTSVAGKTAAANNAVARPGTAVHPRDLPPITRPAVSNTGNPKLDQKYNSQQEALVAKQNQDRQKLQQQQDKEHQQLAKQPADPVKAQRVEQQHAQQTQQLAQRHTQQTQQLQSRQQSSAASRSGGGSRSGVRPR